MYYINRIELGRTLVTVRIFSSVYRVRVYNYETFLSLPEDFFKPYCKYVLYARRFSSGDFRVAEDP